MIGNAQGFEDTTKQKKRMYEWKGMRAAGLDLKSVEDVTWYYFADVDLNS